MLKNEIKKSQENYFVKGVLAEEEYSIKVQMYSEKIRDLRGTLALYIEKKEKLTRDKKKIDSNNLVEKGTVKKRK